MWYLCSQSDPRIIYILPEKEIIIGRSVDAQCCNFAIENDSSISRKHASLSLSDSNLVLQDLGSKYGTFINNSTEKLESNVKEKINIGDIIKFGKLSSEWKCHFIDFTTCTSTLKGESLDNLKVNLSKLGGVLKSEWDDSCGYLTMPAITLTIKVVLALVHGSYIVTTEFWSKCAEAAANFITLPDPKKFIPHIVESTLNKEAVSFLPDDNRKKLFDGKTIIFFSRRQLDMYKDVLTKSSATALLLSETKLTKSMLCGDNIILIQYNLISTSQDTQNQRNQINDIVTYLKGKGKRVVADAEIGLAILYCSLRKYCNPDFNFPTEVIEQKSEDNRIDQPPKILAHESEEPYLTRNQEKLVINESSNSKIDLLNATTSDNDYNVTKRKRDEEDYEGLVNPNKKPAIDNDKTPNNELNSSKRAYEDTDSANLNPAKKIALESTNENENFLNFTESASTSHDINKINKKLNLTKPLKRKQDFVDNDEDNLFNFVEDKPKPTKILKDGTLDCNKSNFGKEQNSLKEVINTSTVVNEKFNISALRGIKLDELIQSNLRLEYKTNVDIKTEDISELDGKLNDLDLGSTTLVLRTDLIVKKEPMKLISEDKIKVLNFKKFKKVWPIKIQMNIISKSCVSSIDMAGNTNSISDIAL